MELGVTKLSDDVANAPVVVVWSWFFQQNGRAVGHRSDPGIWNLMRGIPVECFLHKSHDFTSSCVCASRLNRRRYQSAAAQIRNIRLRKMFRDLTTEHRRTGKAPQSEEIRKWLMDNLTTAMHSDKVQNPGWGPSGMILSMPYQHNTHRNNIRRSLAPEYDLKSPPLLSASSHTIWSQQGETYGQIVDHSDVDSSLAFLPPGISEDSYSPHYKDQMTNWETGTLRAAPLSRPAVQAIQKYVRRLNYNGTRQ